jgi:nucleoside-diphosphate-sugar epimerase
MPSPLHARNPPQPPPTAAPQEGCFDEALVGCSAVMHTASPYFLDCPPGKEDEMLIGPAIRGTENVLNSVNRAPGVKRVLVTSSVVGVWGDPNERGKGHVFTEDDWNKVSWRGGGAGWGVWLVVGRGWWV